MRTIVVASAKGGVGKTTIVAALAVEAARRGQRVAIADLDPLQCLARWHDSRRRLSDAAPIALIEDASTGEQAGRIARRRGDIDWLIIDTAPGPAGRAQSAFKIADLVVVPVRPSPLDVQCLDAVLELADIAEVRHVVVLNGVAVGSPLIPGARAYLDGRSIDAWEQELPGDDAFAVAMIDGQTVTELEEGSNAAQAIAALWAHVERATETSIARRRSP
jgi:chromosome partitioning protein